MDPVQTLLEFACTATTSSADESARPVPLFQPTPPALAAALTAVRTTTLTLTLPAHEATPGHTVFFSVGTTSTGDALRLSTD